MKSTSRYLYNKNERDLYLNYLGSFSENKCFFSRHIPIYIENKDSSSMSFYENHLLSCDCCQEEVRKAEKVISLIADKIPYSEADEYISSHLRSQLIDVDQLLKAKESERVEVSINKKKQWLLQALSDVTVGIVTKSGFYKGIALSLFVYVALRFTL